MAFITKTAPIIIVILTTLGVLMHDMHIDKAATAVVAVPSFVIAAGVLEKAVNSQQHVHVERASIPRASSSLPKMQPPRDDGRRYIQNRKLLFTGGGDAMSLWPSV